MVFTLLFAALLVLVELLEGTDPRYSGLVFCFFMLTTFAFNVAGGFTRPSGAYIFFFALLVVEVGTVYKAILGQPADTFLQEPLLMMGLYVASMAGMLLVAFATRRIATTKDGIAGILKINTVNYTQAALGCFFLYCILNFGPVLLPELGGQLLHSLQIINVFLPLCILLGTVGAIQDSGGRRSTNALTWLALLYSFWTGLLSFSKQGMFTPITCWILGVAWARFRLRLVHLVFIAVFVYFAQLVLVPIAQIGRDAVVTGTESERLDLVAGYLGNISALERRSAEWDPPADLDTRIYYYGEPRHHGPPQHDAE